MVLKRFVKETISVQKANDTKMSVKRRARR